ncbi:MAG: hypothetical protein NC212_08600 [Staphylococcus sp.]|nr:hypothetical protein [Staphylococcus sp.]
MKTKLTPEQSQRLIELGVAPSKASMCMLYFPESDSSEPLEAWQMWEENGKLLCTLDESQVQDVECVIVPKDADYDLSSKEYYPIFDLSDILSLMPKEIHDAEINVTFYLTIEADCNNTWLATYREYYGSEIAMEIGEKSCPELIDTLFELLCWTLPRDKNEKGKQQGLIDPKRS